MIRISATTHHETLQAELKQLIRHADTASMFCRRKRILHHKLDVQVRPDLVEDDAEVVGLCVGEHDELGAGGRFVVV